MQIIDNVSIFPHGILDFNNDKNTSPSKNSLFSILKNKMHKYKFATSGYCLPNKGFLELIKSISLLVEKKLNFHFTFFTPNYNRNYDIYLEKIVSSINEYKLEKYITLDLHYYHDSDLLEVLSQMDAVIYPYQRSNESSSASVRQGIASGSRVIVTPISIFEDVKGVVDVLPGISPEDMALGISNWVQFNEDDRNLEAKNQKIKLLSYWRKNHRFSNLTRRLSCLITALELDKKFNNK